MAEKDATTEAPVMPTQELSSLERAQAGDTRKIEVLDAKQAYNELELFGDTPGEYRPDSPVQGNYWRFKFRGAIVVVSDEFKKAYDNGTLLGLTASPTVFERTVPDPNNAGKNKQQITYGWSLSFSDVGKMEKAQRAIAAAGSVNLKMQLQEVKMKKQIEAISKTDFKDLITDDEIKELMKAI